MTKNTDAKKMTPRRMTGGPHLVFREMWRAAVGRPLVRRKNSEWITLFPRKTLDEFLVSWEAANQICALGQFKVGEVKPRGNGAPYQRESHRIFHFGAEPAPGLHHRLKLFPQQ
jgi:hypothetical protein